MAKTHTKPQGATSYKETAFGILSRKKLLQLELIGSKKGLEHIQSLVKHGRLVITPELICTLHETSFGWIFPRWAGTYRKIQVSFSGKEAPFYYQIPELMINLCRDLKVRLADLPKPETEAFINKVVELLAWFQHGFVFIHPFQDYNGRTARMLTLLILLQLHLPPMELKANTGKDRKQYLTAMQKADAGDFTVLENLISSALIESFEKFSQ